jgi:hypothetical protein
MTPDRDDRELDELLRAVRDRFITRTDASFDFDAGLADVRERADLPFARVPAWRIPPGRGPLTAAVALVCEHVEDLVVALDCLLLVGPLPDLVGSHIQQATVMFHIQQATEVLLRLREEVAAGTISPIDAGLAVAAARDALSQADLILRVEDGRSLPEVLAPDTSPAAGQLDAVLRTLEHEVSEALAAQEHDRAEHRRSAPRRSASGEQRRRSAGGH